MYNVKCKIKNDFKALILHSTFYILHSRAKRGQAAVEFVVALIALLLIVSGGVFVFSLQNARRDMAVTFRGEVGVEALNSSSLPTTAPYIRDWDPGNDQRPGTADDTIIGGSATLFNILADHGARKDEGGANWGYLQEELLKKYAPDRAPPSFLLLRQNPAPMSSLGFFRVEGDREVAVDRFIRQLLIGRESVTVRHEVWLPSCSNLR